MASLDEYLALLGREDDPALTDREKVICNVGYFASELEMGSLSSFLYNVSPDSSSPQDHWTRLRQIIDSLALVGAIRATGVLASLLPQLEASRTDDGTWSGFLAARGVHLNSRDEFEDHDQVFNCLDSYLTVAT